jgi:hypothetical protein
MLASLSDYCFRLCDAAESGGGVSRSGAAPRAARKQRPPAWERFADALVLLAQGGVLSYQMARHPNGADFEAQIDGRKKFRLTPALAHLLELLAADVGTSDDEFVAYKPPRMLAQQLSAREKRTVTRRAVAQRILRLRTELLINGRVNPCYIMSDDAQRSRGVRLVLPRKLAEPGPASKRAELP